VRVFRRTVTVGMTTADVGRMEAFVIGVLVVWLLVALAVAVVLGRGIRLADSRARVERSFTTGDLPVAFRPGVSSARR
jgi:hypothetical protein